MGKPWVFTVKRFEINRDQSGMPVVTMNDVRFEVQTFDRFQNSPGKKENRSALSG